MQKKDRNRINKDPSTKAKAKNETKAIEGGFSLKQQKNWTFSEPTNLNPPAHQRSLKKEGVLEKEEESFLKKLHAYSLTECIQYKLKLFFQKQKEAQVQIDGLYDLILEQMEKPLIELSLKHLNGNQWKTAKMLGINRNTLKRKIQLHGLKIKKKYKKQREKTSVLKKQLK